MKNLKILLLFIVGIGLFSCSDDETPINNVTETATIWSGPDVNFAKTSGADPQLETNQDRITDNVWITRGNAGGQIFNIFSESAADKTASPIGTEWAIGTTADISGLNFLPFREAVGVPKEVVGKDLVLHLITDDVYLDVRFTSWSQTNPGGGFAYTRSSE